MAKRFLTPINLPSRSSDPATASEGDIYFNTSLDAIKVYYNSAWNSISSETVVVSDTPPTNPTEGQLWYESDSGDLFIRYDNSWIQTGGGGGGSGTVTSIDISVPTGLSVTGTPITESGTIAISLASGYVIPTTTELNAKAPLVSPTFTTPNIGGATGSSLVVTGNIIAGNGSGNAGLTINDGYGNSNVVFNHFAGIPDVTGNSARITVNVDSTTGANMAFSIKSGTTSGVAVALTTPFYLYETYGQFTGGIIGAASTTSMPSLRLPHGVAPSSPTNGDIWTTTAGVYARVNGSTIGPFSQAGGPAATVSSSIPAVAQEGSLYFNSSNFTLNISFGGIWMEVGSVPPFDGGSASTSQFDGTMDGGAAATSTWDFTPDLGTSEDSLLLA